MLWEKGPPTKTYRERRCFVFIKLSLWLAAGVISSSYLWHRYVFPDPRLHTFAFVRDYDQPIFNYVFSFSANLTEQTGIVDPEVLEIRCDILHSPLVCSALLFPTPRDICSFYKIDLFVLSDGRRYSCDELRTRHLSPLFDTPEHDQTSSGIFSFGWVIATLLLVFIIDYCGQLRRQEPSLWYRCIYGFNRDMAILALMVVAPAGPLYFIYKLHSFQAYTSVSGTSVLDATWSIN